MATDTPNYQLRKPATSDPVNVETDINDSMDTIDTELKAVSDIADSAIPGAWTTYIMTWASGGAQPAIGNGVKIAAYSRVGKTCHVRGTIQMGSTTTFGGSGDYTLSLPFTAANPSATTVIHIGIVNAIDAGTTYTVGTAILVSGGTTVTITSTSGNNWGPTVPWTWAVNDRLTFSLTYETV